MPYENPKRLSTRIFSSFFFENLIQTPYFASILGEGWKKKKKMDAFMHHEPELCVAETLCSWTSFTHRFVVSERTRWWNRLSIAANMEVSDLFYKPTTDTIRDLTPWHGPRNPSKTEHVRTRIAFKPKSLSQTYNETLGKYMPMPGTPTPVRGKEFR